MSKKVLIIDDYLPLLNSLRIALELNQYMVEVSQCAKEVLEKDECLADILLVDHHLPHLKDLNWLEKLKNNHRFKHIPIILMSGNIEIENIARDLEVDDFIRKPLDINHLLDKLNCASLQSMA